MLKTQNDELPCLDLTCFEALKLYFFHRFPPSFAGGLGITKSVELRLCVRLHRTLERSIFPEKRYFFPFLLRIVGAQLPQTTDGKPQETCRRATNDGRKATNIFLLVVLSRMQEKIPVTDKQTGDLIAVMANSVARARHELSLQELRLILWLISQINRHDDCFRDHVLSIQEFEEILGQKNNGRLHEQIEEACDRLQSRVLEIQTGHDERKKFNWTHSVTYRGGQIKLRLHDLLAPVLLELKEKFCKVPIKTVFKLRGGYSVRWIEMLYSRQHEGTFVLSVEELRFWLAVGPDELKKTDHLRSRAIDYPKDELDSKSPLTFTYKPRKIARRITGWTFTVKKNKPRPVLKKKKGPSAAEPERVTVENLQEIKAALSK